jgi:YlmC/YmxH family sporulation protein
MLEPDGMNTERCFFHMQVCWHIYYTDVAGGKGTVDTVLRNRTTIARILSGGNSVYRSSDLRQKEVINISDGKRLGFVSDVEIDLEGGKIEGIVIPGSSRIFGLLGKDSEFVIPWDRVKKIGEDIILVDMDERFIRKYFD